MLIIANPITAKKLKKMNLRRFTCSCASDWSTPGETSKSLICTHIDYCSRVDENSILKTTISDHYRIVYHLKVDNTPEREVDSVFQIQLWNNIDDLLVAAKLNFK